MGLPDWQNRLANAAANDSLPSSRYSGPPPSIYTDYYSAHSDWTVYRMHLDMACIGYWTCGPFATFSRTPAPYAFQRLSASGFDLPWRTASKDIVVTPAFARMTDKDLFKPP